MRLNAPSLEAKIRKLPVKSRRMLRDVNILSDLPDPIILKNLTDDELYKAWEDARTKEQAPAIEIKSAIWGRK